MPNRVRLMPTTAVRLSVRNHLEAALQEVVALEDSAFVRTITIPFTPSPNLVYGDIDSDPEESAFSQNVLASGGVYPSKDTRQGDYLVAVGNDEPIAWKSAGISGETTIHGYAIVGEADSLVFASFLYDEPVTVTANNQWLPPFEWTVRLPIGFFE